MYYQHLKETVEATLSKSKSETAGKEKNVESNGNINASSDVKQMEVDSTDGESKQPASLEEQAAKEILDDLKSSKEQTKSSGIIHTIPNSDDANKRIVSQLIFISIII